MQKTPRLRTLPYVMAMAALLVSLLLVPAQVAHAINTPWLSVSGRFINDPAGNHVVLRGVSLVDVAVADSRTRNARQLIDMATDNANGWYARVVRLPVYPNAIDGQPGWLAGPDAYYNNHLNPAVQECVARQIYCIIDWHYISDYNTGTIDTSTRAFWTYIAPKYANTPNVIFELYNEPVNPDNWSTWKATAQPWVNLIRASAPNNLILIGGPRWSQNLSSAGSSPFTGSNLVYVAHIYPQHGGQSTWDSWFGNAANTVPFFVTEWGWQQGGANPTSGTQSGYGVPFSNYLESKGLSWTAWVFDDFWQPVMFDTSWNLLGGENFMGQFTKDLLNTHRNDNLPGGGGGATITPTRTATRTNTPTGTTVTPTRTQTRTNTPTFSLPDLVITGMAIQLETGNACYTSTSLGTRVSFSNTGSQAAGPFVVQIVFSDVVRQLTVSGLAAGATGSVWFPINGAATTTTGTIDSAGQVAESNETNNQLAQMLPIPTLPVPCTRTPTPTGVTLTPTRTPTRTSTPTATPTGNAACSPATVITVPFTFDGAGTRCWQISSLSFINSWNVASVTVNGVDFTGKWASPSTLPAKINGNWTISYTGNFPWSHFEAR